MSDCEHGFVTRDACGDYKYICHECKERFTAYPSRVDTTLIKPSPMQHVNMQASLKDFTSGVTTLKDALKSTGHTLTDFKEAVAIFQLARDDIKWEPFDGGLTQFEVPLIAIPRTSCPAEIDKIFSDPNVTLEDLRLITERFPDIKHMNHETNVMTDTVTIRIHFMDNSVQKVYYHPDYTSPINIMRHAYANLKPQADWKWGNK